MKNLPASVRQRLLNRANETGEPFDLLLVRFALERVLYRLSVSPHSDRFVLKGALLFRVWDYVEPRPTRDADLLGFGPSDPGHLVTLFREICGLGYEDGIRFDASSVRAVPIAEDKVYMGVRVTMQAELSRARIPVQVDVGFGDAIIPEPEPIEYPGLLDFPPPVLRAYSVYTMVAEKFQAMVVLGRDNTRMKDFWDLWAIGERSRLDPEVLARAIAATFERRKTPLPERSPLALTDEFRQVPGKPEQWNAFVNRNRLTADRLSLAEAQDAIAALVTPALEALRRGTV